jgi:hypothetical protein
VAELPCVPWDWVESSRFLKKAAQKLLLNWAVPVSPPPAQRSKSFLLLFFKKEAFLSV